MGLVSITLIAIGLAMDAFAVALANGIAIKKLKWRHMLVVGAFFGAFQFLMPIVGWFLGQAFESTIKAYDHWATFILLGIIGGKMLWDSFQQESCEVPIHGEVLSFRNLTMQAIATSIDALAVGVSLALTSTNIYFSASIIGVVAFSFSAIGVYVGKKLGCVFEKQAERLGGLILVVIGAKTLIEHLL